MRLAAIAVLVAACAPAANEPAARAPEPSPEVTLAPLPRDDARPAWISVAPPNAGFVAEMPAAPREETRRAGSAFDVHLFEAELDEGRVAYEIAYADMVGSGQHAAEQAIDHWRDGLLYSQSATLTFERAITLGDVRGVELRLTAPTHVTLARIFTRGARLYEVSVQMPDAALDEAAAARFFASFRLVP